MFHLRARFDDIEGVAQDQAVLPRLPDQSNVYSVGGSKRAAGLTADDPGLSSDQRYFRMQRTQGA